VNVGVTVDGRPWNVAIEPADQPDRYAATVKGLRRVVDVSWIDADTLSLIDGGAVHEIRLHRRENGAIGVEILGRVYECAISTKRGREGLSTRDREQPQSGHAAAVIKAPMPGRVVRVLVSVGEHVRARQGVVVVEAMKMENELRAPRDGTVKEVVVAAGAAVESGAVLVVIE